MTTTPNARNRTPRARLALALEPRILLDAAAVATAADVAAKVDASATAPGTDATPTKSTVTIKDSTDSFGPVNLFDNVKVTLDSSNQAPTELTLQVSSSGSNQALVIDGEQIVLQNGSGFTEANGYSWTVSVENGVSTVTINMQAGLQPATAASTQALIDNLSYQVLDNSVDSGTVSITLKSLTDSGGQSTDLSAIKASVTLDNLVNKAPVLSDSGGLDSRETYTPADLGISNGSDVVWSADGRFAYVAGGNALQVFSVDESGALTRLQTYSNESLGNIADLVISSDGKSIYTSSGSTSIMQLSVDADGKITSAVAVATQNGNTSGNLAISADGRYVYAGTAQNDVVVYTRNQETGALTYLTRAIENGNSRGGQIITSDDRVFILYTGVGVNASPTLAVYQHGSDGKLVLLNQLVLSGLTANSTSDALAISPDGKYLYIADPGKDSIVILRYEADEVTRIASIAASDVNGLAMSADGSLLYAASSDGTVRSYSIDSSGNLTLHTSVQGNTSGKDIAVSGNGSVLVAGDNVTRYSSVQSLNLGQATRFGEDLSFKDSNFDRLDNYNGASISVAPSAAGGSFGLAEGNGLTLDGNTIKRGGNTIASFTVAADGSLTVTFTADTSKAVANQVLQQLAYSAASSTTPGSLMTLQVSISDGVLASGVLSLTLRANSVPVGNAGSYVPPKATSETGYSTVLPADLFSDADGDALVWSVSGLPDGLSFDRVTRTISGTTTATGEFGIVVTATDASGQSASVELPLDVEQVANRAPEHNSSAADTVLLTVGNTSATLDQALFSDKDQGYGDTLTWSLDGLPTGVTFDPATRTLIGDTSATGDYTIEVTVTDSAGASTSTELTLRVISQAEADNSKPVLEADSSTLVYTSNGGLSGFSSMVYSVEVSDDGLTVFVLSNGTNNHAVTPGGASTLGIYSRDPATGALTLVQSIVQGASDDGNAANGVEVDGLNGAASAVYSSDGKQLYLVGQKAAGGNYVVTVFNVNADGTLTASGQSLDAGATQIKQMTVGQDGTLYAVAGSTLLVFKADADGGLAAASVITDSSLNPAYAVATDAQGSVYVLGSSRLVVYEADGQGGLTRSAEITTGLTIYNRSLAVSADGYVYVAAAIPGSVQAYHYDSASNTLVRIASVATAGQTWGVALSADGKTLYAGSNTGSLYIFRIDGDGKPVLVKQLDGIGARAYRIAVSADGESIYAGGFFTAAGLANISISDAAQLDYTEGQASVIHPGANLGVSDAELDALASGAGNYNGAVITLERDGGANPDDLFDFTTGNGLTRSGEQIQLNGTTIATITRVDGKLTVTFTADTTKAVANQVLRQISYANASTDPEASISLKLTFQDGYKSGTTSRELVVQVATVNDAPQVSTTPVDSQQEPGKDSVKLFDASAIDAVEAGQTITGLTFTVSGVKDGASETLLLDGTQIALVAGSGITASGLSYTVSLSDGTATVVLGSAAGISASAAAAVVDGARYANTDSKGATLGVRSITLSAVKDSGGTANGGSDTATTTFSAEVEVTRQSPVLGADIGALELAELVQSGDWPNPYAGINGVVSVGDQVYVLRSTSEWVYDDATGTGADVTFSTLYVFTRGADGTLTLASTLDATASNGLGEGTSGLGLSADGKTLYLSTDSHGIAVFSRDTSSGALTALGTFGADAGLANDVLVQGNTAYISSDSGLLVFTRTGDSWAQSASLSPTDGNAWFSALQLSADGKYLFAANSGGNTLVSVYAVGDNGALSLVQHLAGSAGEHYANSLALAADGKTLYVADGTTLYSLQVGADGKLAQSGASITLPAAPKALVVSDDGSALIAVGESQVSLYKLGSDGTLGNGQQLNIDGVRLSEIRAASLSADGTQLYLTGEFGSEGLLVLNLTAQSSTFTEGGDAVAVLPGATLHDPQLDALDDYKGASIVIQRDGGASAEDVFSLLTGSGLTLENGQVLLDGQAIASFVQADGVLTVSFIASVSQANAQQVLRSIAYSNSSQDPASSATLSVQVTDGDGHSDSRLVQLAIEAVNDAPVVDTTGLTPVFNAEGEPVKLFESTQIDVVEAGQQVWQVVLTLDPTANGDIIGVNGGKIYLDDTNSGVQTSASGQQYVIIRSGGQTQLVLYVNGNAQRAQALVDSLTYSNSGDNLAGTRTISLSVVDNGGGTDKGTASSQALVTLHAALAPNTAPTLGGGNSTVGYTEQGEPVYLAPGASVSDTQMDAFNNGQGNYDGAVLTVTLGDGHSSSDQLGFKDGNGLSVKDGKLVKDGKVIGTLTVADGVLTLRFSDAAGQVPTTADVNNALQQITYANSSDVPVASVAVTIALSDQRGLAADSLALTVNITAVNDAPVLGNDPVLSMGDLDRVQDLDLSAYGLASPSASVVSADGARVYIVDGQGHIALFSRSESGVLTHVSTLNSGVDMGHLQLSGDGKNLYALRSDGNAILVFNADAQGSLTLAATVVSDYAIDASALYDMRDLALSADGKTLFVINAYTVLYFSRDNASGALTYGGSLEGNMWGAPYLWSPTEIVSKGDLLFVVTNSGNGSSLIVYQQGSDGALTLLGYSREGDGALSGLTQVSVSADGKIVYVANDSQVSGYSLAGDTLTWLGNVQGGGTITDIAVSADGALLFITLQDGTVNRYSTATGALTGTVQVGGAGQLLVTDNGALVLGNDASVLASEAKDGPSLDAEDRTPLPLAPSITLSDPELDAANNYQGASLAISGQASDSIGLLAGGAYTLSGNNVLLDGNVVATLVRDGNVTTLTFTAALTRDQATALVRQLSWTSSADAPAQASSHAITLVLNDGSNGDALNSNSFNIDVTLLPPNQPPVLNDAYSDYSLTPATAGTGYQLQLPADLFSDPEGETLTYSIEGLPAGMAFNPATRTLSGTAPREVGSLSLTIKATDASGKSTTLVLELDVANAVPVADAGYHLPGVSVGQPYEVQVPHSLFRDANDDNLAWSVVGELPEWLSFDADSHTFSGTAPASAGSFSITLRADDGQGGVTEVTLTLVVARPASNDGVAPVINATGDTALPLAASNTPFELEEAAPNALQITSEPALQPAAESVRHSSLDDGGLASNRNSLAAQLANADRIVTDTGFQGEANEQLRFDGKTLRAEVELGNHDGRWVSLRVPLEVADSASMQRVTLANGLPLPSWAAFDARSGEIRIDSRHLQRHGEVRLSLVLRDADGREQRVPLHIRAQGQEPARADTAEAPATLSQQLGRQASGSLYTEAMDLLQQLGEWANDDFQHIA
ncbi:beta-propeller fold lactonase family protein [Pseudomonas xanthosomatis]|uniref:beta-propeller fold lactonase family protein n=1 Tax=Pseudomonas xanthosomatis TaxID=2842356 RepID=UPI001C3C92C5|nr:beta-propeller fold lactonase family protein [Pseudomonas xanthosomatis]QXH48787.1 beta-propeller fold lactonase family protein [Pseudomonas xanthosomatis]